MLDLDLLSNAYYSMANTQFDVADFPDYDGGYRELKLEDGKLTAYYIVGHAGPNMWKNQSAHRGWSQRIIDLKQIVVNQDGRLRLYGPLLQHTIHPDTN